MRHRTSPTTPQAGRTMKTLAAVGLGLTLALTATACGDGSDDSTSRSPTSHNAADVTFATDMIQHHAQALSMVDLTVDRTLDPQVEALAEAIREAQGPEIETMSDWLTDWDEEIPETMRDHTNAGHDMGDMSDSMEGMNDSMPGMMSADDMDALQNASGAEFQDMWLEMMIQHHAGAIEMARTEQKDGQYEPAVDLAGEIVIAQKAEIEEMKSLIGS
ncbi:DUF305 domain-containing protein [Nocardioides conyzicola]|uniref:DUF305 domain-containing protein n=1 Tax=Nocardioides conyzicola TaxID=1651781 RepID=A0ABP8XAM7_9ACTN